jgi:hypothetical protein
VLKLYQGNKWVRSDGMSENQAELNLKDFDKAYAELKKLLKQSSDADIEEYIRISKEQAYVEDEEKLRQQFYEIRDAE